jgi:hypothetical protein
MLARWHLREPLTAPQQASPIALLAIGIIPVRHAPPATIARAEV